VLAELLPDLQRAIALIAEDRLALIAPRRDLVRARQKPALATAWPYDDGMLFGESLSPVADPIAPPDLVPQLGGA
jgi:hypothetical protein